MLVAVFEQQMVNARFSFPPPPARHLAIQPEWQSRITNAKDHSQVIEQFQAFQQVYASSPPQP